MKPVAAKILADAMSLDLDERAALAKELIVSLDAVSEEDVDEAWARETERRIDAWRAGESKAIAWSEAEARLLHRLARVRSTK